MNSIGSHQSRSDYFEPHLARKFVCQRLEGMSIDYAV